MVKIPSPQMIEVSQLKSHPTNVKDHPESQINNLVKMIEMVGFNYPIMIDDTNTIRGGHGRLLAAKQLGMTEVPCIRLEGMTTEQLDLFIYMDNKINESPWNKENLKLVLKDIPTIELETYDLEWDKIIEPDIIEESNETPEPPLEPKSKLGDIYQLGNHRIMCGDSNKDIQKLLENKKADLLLTDPPYNVGGEMDYEFYKNTHSPAMKKLSQVKWDIDFEPKFAEKLNDYMNEDSFVYIFTSHILFGEMVELVKKWSKYDGFLVWCKTNPMPSLTMRYWTWATELIVFGTHGKHIFNFTKGEHDLNYILESKNNDTVHPTEKPLKLLQNLITHSSNKGQLVLDLFLGSGSTLIACEQTDRICYGMELEPAYVDVVVQRWENFTGKKAVKI